MENKIYRISASGAEKIKNELEVDQDAYLVILDGSLYQSWNDYVNGMAQAFKFPKEPHYNVNAYLDWMTDLEWLNKEKYVLMIYHFDQFMQEDAVLKKNLITYFKEDILPFWEEEVTHTVVGAYPKSFNVYLVD